MIKRWISILLTTLLVTVLTAAGYAYEIDRVCQGAERTYRINGEAGSTWAWTLVNQTGDTLDISTYPFKDFSDLDTDGNLIQGSEITVTWDLPPGTYTLSAEQTSTHGCENYELGTIEVLPNPVINAGPDLVACDALPVDILGATASHYDSLAWTTLGDGTFTSSTDLITNYTPGSNDIAADSTILVLTAFGLGNNGTCEVASDTLVVRISNLQLTVNHTNILCNGANNGTITANAQGGYGTYTYRWQGPDGYTSVGPEILNLKPGTYDLEVTDEAGCKATTSVTLTEPNPIQLSASIIDAYCGGKTPGSIDLTVTGGTPNPTAPFYTYEWTDSLLFTATTEDITNLVGDRFYYVKVTDALGCSDTLQLFVNEERNIEITYTADSINCYGGNEGAIDIDVKFGKKPYSYEWQHGPTDEDLAGLTAGSYWLIVTDDRGCTADTIITLGQPDELLAQVSPDPAESCLGDTIQLNATATGGSGSYTHTWEGSGALFLSSTNIANPEFRDAPAGSYQLIYIVNDSLMCEARDTIEVNIKDNVQPVFANIDDLCQFSTPPSLPGISDNGIDGIWSPATISTDVAGTFDFVFTPDPSHECALPETIQVTITPQIVPEFAPIADLCQNSIAPALPDQDLNGITGTWSPDTIMTDIDGTFRFVFTPAATYTCAEPDTIFITVTPQAVPNFAGIGPFCEGDVPPALPTTSPNGISGTWTPAAINTADAGIFLFVFEPDGTVACSTNDTLYITVTKTLIPRLADIGPLCQGSMSPELPDTDLDGITGTWSADTINTQVPGTYTYTFTPDNTYACAVSAQIEVTILDLIDPEFNPIADLCMGAIPPALPTADINGVTGTWSPDIIDTSAPGTFKFHFTPDASYQCASMDSLTVTINEKPLADAPGNVTACESYTLPALTNGAYFAQSGGMDPIAVGTVITTDTVIYVFAGDPTDPACFAENSFTVTITDTPMADAPVDVTACDSYTLPALTNGAYFAQPGGVDPIAVGTVITKDTTIYVFAGDPTDPTCFAENSFTITITDTPLADAPVDVTACDSYTLPALTNGAYFAQTGGVDPIAVGTVFTTDTVIYVFAGDPTDPTCFAENSFTVTITDTPMADAPGNVTACESYTLPALTNGAYFAQSGGMDPIAVGTVITTDTVIYVFAGNPTDPTCFTENSFTITITDTPLADAPVDVTACDSYTLPALTNGAYFAQPGGVDPIAVGTVFTTDTVIYVFAGDPTDPTCFAENSFTITITDTPLADAPVDVTACDSYTLPALTNGAYFAQPGGVDPIAVGTVFTTDTVIYVFAGDPTDPTCFAENSFTITITDTPLADAPIDVTVCDSYTLPALTNGSYFAQTGGVDPIAVGTIITKDTTIYVFAGDPTDPTCFAENSFTVTITDTPLADAPIDVTVCDSYTLPALTNGAYFTQAGGVDPIAEGTEITETTTIYVFAGDPTDPTCFAENSFTVTIQNTIKPEFDPIASLCLGDTPPALPATDKNGITGTWTPNTIDTSSPGIFRFVFEPDASVACPVNDTLFVTVTNTLRPRLADIGPLCRDSEAPTLPATDEDGITGTWSPAVIDTRVAGSFTYEFTPDASYSCAVPGSITIVIEELPFLEANDPAPVCEPSVIDLTADEILTGDKTGLILSYWQDAETTIAVDKPDSIWYSGIYFIKAINLAGCDTTLAINVFINPIPELIVNSPEAVCEPLTVDLSDDRIVAGSDPGLIFTYWADSAMTIPIDDPNNIAVGGRYYICAENAGNCRIVKGVDVTIHRSVTTDFAQIGPFCQDEIAPSLPDIDLNGVPGTWAPDTIITTIPGIYEFIFTPDPTLECAVPDTILVTVNPTIVPEFDPIDPICQDAPAPALPLADNNGITGTWAPSAIATDVAGTFTFIFTPDAGQGCVLNDTIEVVVNPTIVPEFDPLAAVCQGTTAPLLPTADNNGITGSWTPAVIDTETAGIFEFIFTPDAGQGCTVNDTLTITITPAIVPEIDLTDNFCVGEVPPALPLADNNGVTGNWLPDTISTETAGTFTFIFTPDVGVECAVNDTLTVTIHPSIVPEFDPIDPICQDTAAPALPLADNTGITGTWAPSAIATDVAGTFTFIFTPDAGQGCVLNDTIEVVVNPTIVPEFDPLAAVCQGTTAPVLPTSDKNGITGSWAPAVIDTETAGIFEFIFTPDAGQGCTVNDTLTITITPAIVPEFDLTDNFCVGDVPPALPLADLNGVAGTWSPSAISTAIAGIINYTFTPETGIECAEPLTVPITVHEKPAPVVVANQPDCDVRLGSIVVTSPTAGLEFSLDGGAFVTYPASGFTDLEAGTYILTTRNGNLCEVADTLEILVSPEIPDEPVLAEVPANCDETTRAFDVVSPVGTEYEYSIDGSTWQASRNFSNLAPATYTLRVRNLEGCENSGTITLDPAPTAPAVPVLTSTSPSCDVPTGSITVSSPTGTGLEYSIDGTTWQSAPLFENLTPGDYTVRVRNSAACESSSTVTINPVPDMPEKPVADITQPNCNITTGKLTVTAPLAGNLEYSIDDTNWQSDPVFAGLAAGTYTLWVRNESGCKSSDTFVIVPSTGISLADVVVSHVLCYGESNGFITLTATTGPNPVFSWTGPNGYTAATEDISGLVAGMYSLKITDDNLCVKDTVIEIRQPDAALNAIALPTNVTRPYANDGTITLDISGGTPGYNVTWTGPDGFTATIQNLTGLSAGVYTATITDLNGCPFNLPPITITQPDGTVTLPEPAPMVLCPTAPLPAAIQTYPEYITAIGAGTTDCPEGFDETTFRLVSEVSDGLRCPETIVRTYQITDKCGMTATVEHVFIKNDNLRPNFNYPNIITVECQAEVRGYTVFKTLEEFVNAGGFASDNCAIDPATFKYAGDGALEGTECDGMIRRRYTVEDFCGNQSTAEVQFRIIDRSGPRVRNYKRTLTAECAAPAPYRNINDFRADGGVADDNDCGNVTLKLLKTDTISVSCPMELVRTYELTDRCGNITTFQQTVIVDDQTSPVFAAIPDFLGECEPGMEAKINQWLRDVTATDNCKVKSITNDFNIANLPADCCGDLIVNFVAVDECGNSTPATGIIRLKAKVSVDIDPINALACEGSSITFTAEPHNGGSNPKFQWYRNGTAVAGQTGITYTIANPQAGDKVYVRLTSDITCTDVKEANSPVATVTITNILTPAVSVAPLNPDICEGETVTFTAIPVNGGTNPGYQWLVNGQPVAGATAATFTYAPKDQDQITVRMTSDLVCVDVQTVTSAPAVAKVIPNLVVTVDLSANRDTVCEGEPVTLQAVHENGGTNPLFTWYVNNNAVPGNNTDTYTFIPNKGDVVRVTLTSSERCVVDRTVSSGIHTLDVLVVDPVTIVCPPDVSFECLGSVPPITDIDEMISLGYIRNAHHANRSSLNHVDRLSKTPQETVILRTYYIEDLCGHIDSCTQRITISDNEPPVAVPQDVTVYLDETGVYTVDRDDILESASDNCTPFDKLVIRAVPPTVDCTNVGDIILVQIIVIDEAGNESIPVYANITVLDQMPPEALCRDITVYLDEDGKASITPADIDNGSTDNCQIVSRNLDRTTFDCNSVGVNPVRLTVVDASGNMDFCDAMVTVIDTIAPVAICQSVDIQIGPNGQVRLSPTMVDGGSYDNCGVPSLKIEPEFLTCENIGENIVTLYVTDRYGNVSSCQTIVNVLGNTPPIARDDNVKALMNQNTLILILLNDTDAEGDVDPSTVWIMTPPEHGSLTVNPTGGVIYKPFDNYLGPDTFTYRVCDNGLPCYEECDTAVVTITVVEDNLAPIARDDEYDAGCLAISGNILTNDSDPDGDKIFLSPYLILPPANGEIELNADGSFLYVSKSGYVGLDSLIYQICDDGYPSKCDTATVTFNIFKDEDCDGEPDEGPLTFFIPEGFSPNGDGVHDFFQILGIEEYPDAKLYIFNRWGNKLFEKEHYGNLTYWGSPEEAWWWGYSEASLTLGGGKVPVGNYIYILELGNGTTHTGTVMVSY